MLELLFICGFTSFFAGFILGTMFIIYGYQDFLRKGMYPHLNEKNNMVWACKNKNEGEEL